MAPDHVGLDLADLEVATCVLQGSGRVMKTVPFVAILVPVVQKVVMEQGAADQRTLIDPEMKLSGQADAHGCYVERMVVDALVSVLHEGAAFLHALGGQYIAAVTTDQFGSLAIK